MRVRTFVLSASIVAALAMPAGAQQQYQFLSPPPGTNVFTASSALASLAKQKYGMNLTVSTSAGPQVQVPQLNQGKGEFNILNGADSYQAVHGIEPFYREKNPNLRMMGIAYSNQLGLIALASSGIKKAEDIKGKRVTGVFSAHKTCLDLASMQLANMGLSWDDVRIVPVSHSRDAAPAVSQGRADVALCIPVGQAVIKEVHARTPIRFVSMSPGADAVARGRKHYPIGTVVSMPKGSGEGVEEDTNVWEYPFYMVTSTHVPDELVYNVTKMIYENIEDLRKVNPIFETWPKEKMAEADVTIPYHPAAIRYFKEIRLWTPEMEKAQARLLAEIKG